MQVYVPWCEWDIGLNGVGYTTEELARKEIKRAFNTVFKNDPDTDFDDCFEAGFVGWNRMTILSEETQQ